MRRVAALKATSAGLEVVGSSQPVAVQARQELRGGVAVEIWEAEGVGRGVPPGAEPEEVGQGSVGIAGLGC